VLVDWRLAEDYLAAGHFNEYRGKFVAVLKGELIGHGADPLKLRQKLARIHAVDPERLVILYVDDGTIYAEG
jgi:hypothetical protein